MRCLVHEVSLPAPPERIIARLAGQPGTVLLRSAAFEVPHARYSFCAAQPFLTFTAHGSQCELRAGRDSHLAYGDPWRILGGILPRYELLQELDWPFPAGGCFGYWGYDLKQFCEPRLRLRTAGDLSLPDAWLGFYDHLLVMDHHLGKAWIIATGLRPDGSRSELRARQGVDFWRRTLDKVDSSLTVVGEPDEPTREPWANPDAQPLTPTSSLDREPFIGAVLRAKEYIRQGHIYQVNLARRLTVPGRHHGWPFFQKLMMASPAPFAAYVNTGEFQLASSSPELFLRLSGEQVQTRPIKGTRPRSCEPDQDARYAYELQTSPKELAELVMITDLLRNDLGRVCEYGSVRVPDLARLEKFSQVQHLVSTVEGRLAPDLTQLEALRACFPGGSITGAPKFRAMEIIEELEPVRRGPYTGCLGYLGFNRESQLSIIIRTALCCPDALHFHTGAGIVADSDPAAEFEETETKALGFLNALRLAWDISRSAEQPLPL